MFYYEDNTYRESEKDECFLLRTEDNNYEIVLDKKHIGSGTTLKECCDILEKTIGG